MSKTINFDDFLAEQLKDGDFRREYENSEPAYQMERDKIKGRIDVERRIAELEREIERLERETNATVRSGGVTIFALPNGARQANLARLAEMRQRRDDLWNEKRQLNAGRDYGSGSDYLSGGGGLGVEHKLSFRNSRSGARRG